MYNVHTVLYYNIARLRRGEGQGAAPDVDAAPSPLLRAAGTVKVPSLYIYIYIYMYVYIYIYIYACVLSYCFTLPIQ